MRYVLHLCHTETRSCSLGVSLVSHRDKLALSGPWFKRSLLVCLRKHKISKEWVEFVIISCFVQWCGYCCVDAGENVWEVGVISWTFGFESAGAQKGQEGQGWESQENADVRSCNRYVLFAINKNGFKHPTKLSSKLVRTLPHVLMEFVLLSNLHWHKLRGLPVPIPARARSSNQRRNQCISTWNQGENRRIDRLLGEEGGKTLPGVSSDVEAGDIACKPQHNNCLLFWSMKVKTFHFAASYYVAICWRFNAMKKEPFLLWVARGNSSLDAVEIDNGNCPAM
jgi:hypothetical protein